METTYKHASLHENSIRVLRWGYTSLHGNIKAVEFPSLEILWRSPRFTEMRSRHPSLQGDSH